MVGHEDFLFEIISEELPANFLLKVETILVTSFCRQLKNLKISYGTLRSFVTPRRIAILIDKVSLKQEDRVEERFGPFLKDAFDSKGCAQKSALGFAKAYNVELDKLETTDTPKGKRLLYSSIVEGENTIDLLVGIIRESVSQLASFSPMNWGRENHKFMRPVQNIVALIGAQVVKLSLFGLTAHNKTYGHRAMSESPLLITHPQNYEKILREQGFVIANFQERRKTILTQVKLLTDNNFKPLLADDLLDEIVGLVEYPKCLLASFAEKYLSLPRDCLVTIISKYQKSIPLLDNLDNLSSKFIIVLNLDSCDPHRVISGNEFVISAKLEDARYFYTRDINRSLYDNVVKLEEIIYHKRLGSMKDKTERLIAMNEFLAKRCKANVAHAKEAALLSKTDLLTEMVGEFPDLEGIIGYYLAIEQKIPRDVALALREQYYPCTMSGQVAETVIGQILAIAERMDNLVGFFAIDLIPDGNSDPFGLRRAALGVLKTILDRDIDINLTSIIEFSLQSYNFSSTIENLADKLRDFFNRRFKFMMHEKGFSHEEIDSVEPAYQDNFYLRFLLLSSLHQFREREEIRQLIETSLRINNILLDRDEKFSKDRDQKIEYEIQDNSERELVSAINHFEKVYPDFLLKKDFVKLLESLAELTKPVDNLFKNVMVLAEDRKLRQSRLAMLKKIAHFLSLVGDLSKLVKVN